MDPIANFKTEDIADKKLPTIIDDSAEKNTKHNDEPKLINNINEAPIAIDIKTIAIAKEMGNNINDSAGLITEPDTSTNIIKNTVVIEEMPNNMNNTADVATKLESTNTIGNTVITEDKPNNLNDTADLITEPDETANIIKNTVIENMPNNMNTVDVATKLESTNVIENTVVTENLPNDINTTADVVTKPIESTNIKSTDVIEEIPNNMNSTIDVITINDDEVEFIDNTEVPMDIDIQNTVIAENLQNNINDVANVNTELETTNITNEEYVLIKFIFIFCLITGFSGLRLPPQKCLLFIFFCILYSQQS